MPTHMLCVNMRQVHPADFHPAGAIKHSIGTGLTGDGRGRALRRGCAPPLRGSRGSCGRRVPLPRHRTGRCLHDRQRRRSLLLGCLSSSACAAAVLSQNDPGRQRLQLVMCRGRHTSTGCCSWLRSLGPADGRPILRCRLLRCIESAHVLREAVLPCMWLRSGCSRALVSSLLPSGGGSARLHAGHVAICPSRHHSFGPGGVLQTPPGLRWLREPTASRDCVCGRAARRVCSGGAGIDGGERVVEPRAPAQCAQRGILDVPSQVCPALRSMHKHTC